MDDVMPKHRQHLLFDEFLGDKEVAVLLVLVWGAAQNGRVDVRGSGEVALDCLALPAALTLLWDGGREGGREEGRGGEGRGGKGGREHKSHPPIGV